ncbi:hypothetical protein CI109_106338 [Kwoniella shandongensis]|uniref:Uncharacterized protein n=1 Tax=Kwoniella shandongensis TaxID=1734106 RepID=A0A5M6BPD2_9TREE|nr:uncharacterized protein CI109_007091 [Kwoniella shandongensis]KAA5524603.1 hypothetical protein CI109_007091 [Kwoniella shandongensis]
MVAQRNQPFRAEHLGSLLRPTELLKTRTAFEAGRASAEELKKEEDEAVKIAVDMQKKLGYRGVSDGEYRRGVFWGSFFQELEGMTEVQNPPLELFRTYVPDIAGFLEKGGPGQSCLCTGHIKHTGKSTLIDEYEYTKSLVDADRAGEVKLTMISPVWYHLRYREGKAYPTDVYANDEEYFAAIAEAYRTELDILYKAGVRNIQIDDPNFAYFCSEAMIEGWEADKSNKRTLDELLDVYIKCYNDCLSQHKDKIHFGLHICRGNFRGSRHFSEGGYDRIASKLLKELDVSTYYLEYDTPRAGSFEPLAQLPINKNVVLGVISSKFSELEDKSAVKERIYAAADVMAKGAGQTREQALDRVFLSPQCGFASHQEGNAIVWQDMENKLRLVREIADELWPGQP